VARTIADLEAAAAGDAPTSARLAAGAAPTSAVAGHNMASGGRKSSDNASRPADTAVLERVKANPITSMHISEAINYRMLDRNLWK
jgi:hypothetical protein